ncbi:complement factor H-related protein 5-like [Python bivittatus]|uniref:Complement factor H-related protein 5-like n=1 Tax=Python bivittatus TaxID=176946 RepID=A0A9F5MYB7_PYTBI|nr:complement factor H-related protein 5-like [Python bivittatus]
MCSKPLADAFILNTTKSVFLSGDELHYECKEGLETIKNTIGDTIVCREKGWEPTPGCLPIECEPPVLDNVRIDPRLDKFQHKMVVHFKCLRGFTRVGPESSQCYHFGWSPQPPICKENVQTCQAPPSILHGMVIGELKQVYQHGDTLEVQCDISFAPYGSKFIECVDGEWAPLPSCTEELILILFIVYNYLGQRFAKYVFVKETCPPPPQLPNAINIAEMRIYRSGEEISFRCEEHFRLHGPQKIKCEDGKWQTPPRCLDLGETCGRPPPLDNGDILEIAKVQYLSGESVTYQCQSYHRMEGSPKVTCENGHWMEKPRCIVPCTASEEDMIYHNIQLRWRQSAKLYIANGDAAEFQCKGGYQPHPNSRPFRVTCTEGKFQYPHCTKV